MIDNLPLILMIETSTQICSVAISKGKEILAIRDIDIPNAHSSRLSLLIEEILEETNLRYKDLSAIAVSKGPGSYTGLRIGVSSAKGFAYGLDIPLISVETLRILQKAVKVKYPQAYALTMIDARRMEVYCSIFDEQGNIVKELSADIIEEDIYKDYFKPDKQFVVVGDGANKCSEAFSKYENLIFDEDIKLSTRYMSEMVYDKFVAKDFEDVAYFEPYYLKNFVAAPAKVKGLY